MSFRLGREIGLGCADGLSAIREASQNGLTLCFAGVGSAFAKRNTHTALIVAKKGVTLLIDCGSQVPKALAERGVSLVGFDFYHVTHAHADHVGGLEELLFLNYFSGHRKVPLLLTESFEKSLWEHSLRGGCEFTADARMQFSDFIEPIRPIPIETDGDRLQFDADLAGICLRLFQTQHLMGGAKPWRQAFWSNGIRVDERALYTCDTRFDPDLFREVGVDGVDAIFHDCQLFPPGYVHATYEELKTLPPAVRNRILLSHYGDNFDQFDSVTDGFAGFAQPWRLYHFD